MEELRRQLKALIEDMPKLFQQLRESLLDSCTNYNELLQLERQFNDAEREWKGGRLSKENHNLTVNRVVDAVLDIIGKLQASDLKPAAQQNASGKKGRSFGDYHRFTCDRTSQNDRFHLLFRKNKEKKVHFFYLFGGKYQSHKGIFQRFYHDLEGRLQDYLRSNTAAEEGCHSIERTLTFQKSGDPETYKINILASLFAAFDIDVNALDNLNGKNLAWLWNNSPSLRGLGVEEEACIFLSIPQRVWDANITPQVVRWFIEDFCAGDLPQNCPSFLFFFALIFDEKDTKVRTEVANIVNQSSLIEALPELNMVSRDDLAYWFETYDFIYVTSRQRDQAVDKICGEFGCEEFYMEDVELALQQVIDDYRMKSLQG